MILSAMIINTEANSTIVILSLLETISFCQYCTLLKDLLCITRPFDMELSHNYGNL